MQDPTEGREAPEGRRPGAGAEGEGTALDRLGLDLVPYLTARCEPFQRCVTIRHHVAQLGASSVEVHDRLEADI